MATFQDARNSITALNDTTPLDDVIKAYEEYFELLDKELDLIVDQDHIFELEEMLHEFQERTKNEYVKFIELAGGNMAGFFYFVPQFYRWFIKNGFDIRLNTAFEDNTHCDKYETFYIQKAYEDKQADLNRTTAELTTKNGELAAAIGVYTTAKSAHDTTPTAATQSALDAAVTDRNKVQKEVDDLTVSLATLTVERGSLGWYLNQCLDFANEIATKVPNVDTGIRVGELDRLLMALYFLELTVDRTALDNAVNETQTRLTNEDTELRNGFPLSILTKLYEKMEYIADNSQDTASRIFILSKLRSKVVSVVTFPGEIHDVDELKLLKNENGTYYQIIKEFSKIPIVQNDIVTLAKSARMLNSMGTIGFKKDSLLMQHIRTLLDIGNCQHALLLYIQRFKGDLFTKTAYTGIFSIAFNIYVLTDLTGNKGYNALLTEQRRAFKQKLDDKGVFQEIQDLFPDAPGVQPTTIQQKRKAASGAVKQVKPVVNTPTLTTPTFAPSVRFTGSTNVVDTILGSVDSGDDDLTYELFYYFIEEFLISSRSNMVYSDYLYIFRKKTKLCNFCEHTMYRVLDKIEYLPHMRDDWYKTLLPLTTEYAKLKKTVPSRALEHQGFKVYMLVQLCSHVVDKDVIIKYVHDEIFDEINSGAADPIYMQLHVAANDAAVKTILDTYVTQVVNEFFNIRNAAGLEVHHFIEYKETLDNPPPGVPASTISSTSKLHKEYVKFRDNEAKLNTAQGNYVDALKILTKACKIATYYEFGNQSEVKQISTDNFIRNRNVREFFQSMLNFVVKLPADSIAVDDRASPPTITGTRVNLRRGLEKPEVQEALKLAKDAFAKIDKLYTPPPSISPESSGIITKIDDHLTAIATAAAAAAAAAAAGGGAAAGGTTAP